MKKKAWELSDNAPTGRNTIKPSRVCTKNNRAQFATMSKEDQSHCKVVFSWKSVFILGVFSAGCSTVFQLSTDFLLRVCFCNIAVLHIKWCII